MNPMTKPISVVLKEARQNKGISLEEAHKATRIHHNILRSLEEGTTLGLSHVYVKSYIKIYAKYLGINQHEVDKHFHPAAVKEKKINLDVPAKTKEIKINLNNAPLFTNLTLQLKKFKKPIIFLAVSLIALFILITLFNRPSRKDAVVLSKVTIEDKKPVTKPVAVKEVKPKEVVKESFPKIDGDLKLTITAKEDTWLQVKKDGQVVFIKTLIKSASETWTAKESLELRIANAGTIDLELNGKILAPLGKRGELLRSVLITKDGIKKQ